jgi:hypothetical protein
MRMHGLVVTAVRVHISLAAPLSLGSYWHMSRAQAAPTCCLHLVDQVPLQHLHSRHPGRVLTRQQAVPHHLHHHTRTHT